MTYKLKYKIRSIDFYLVIIGLLFTVCSHLIASKIIVFDFLNYSIPLMVSSFTYTIVLTMSNLVRTYSTKLNAIKFVIIEILFILFFIIITSFFITIPSPSWGIPSTHLHEVIKLTFSIFKANCLGIIVVSIIDIFLFSFLFNKVFYKANLYFRFIFSNTISALIILAVYVYVTDSAFLYELYPNHWLSITNYNLLSNIVMIIIYSIIWSIVLKFIKFYLAKE